MKMKILKKRFLFLGLLLLILIYAAGTSLILSGCGGGGSSPFSTPAPNNTASTPAVTGYNNVMYVYLDDYADEDAPDIPYVYVYINGGSTPIPLLLDTGATGILINKSALTAAGVNIASTSNSFSVVFGDSTKASGYVNNLDVYTAASGGGTAAYNIPVAIATSDTAFISSGFLQGDFGMGLSPCSSFGQSDGSIYTPSFSSAVSDNNYNNGFIINFRNITFTNGYTIINNPQNNPVGTITLGLNTESDNALSAQSEFYPNSLACQEQFPMLASLFGGYTSDSTGYAFYSFFDTGSNFIFLGTEALDDSIGSGASTNDVITSGLCSSFVYGGLTVNFSLLNSNESYYPNSFITEPDNGPNNSFCDYQDAINAMSTTDKDALAFKYAVYYVGSKQGQEDFGTSFMFGNILFWQAQTANQTWGVGVE